MVKSPSLAAFMRGDVALGDIIKGGLGSAGRMLDSVVLEGFSMPRDSVVLHQPLAPLLPVQVPLLGLVGLSEGIQAVEQVGSPCLEARQLQLELCCQELAVPVTIWQVEGNPV